MVITPQQQARVWLALRDTRQTPQRSKVLEFLENLQMSTIICKFTYKFTFDLRRDPCVLCVVLRRRYEEHHTIKYT